MRPVAIFRHFPLEGPGYFGDFLDSRHIPWVLIPIDEGASVPADEREYSGFCFMGGPMSVNDGLPWISPACALIRNAVARDIPVLGHCLGAQLISKALGGSIARNPVREIGWGAISAHADDIARHWFGEQAGRTHTVFHWHGETFSLPKGAALLASSEACAHQIFALGPHLAMQCHVEILAETVARWSRQWQDEIDRNAHVPTVQSTPAMLAATPGNLAALHQLADRLYSVWVEGLTRK
jgi:GMP synthase-like glutamine amidotransferase